MPSTLARPVQRVFVLGVAAVGLASLHLTGRPHTLCLFRAVTGIPCPFCGGTTAAVEMGRGRVAAALAANPLVILGATALVLATTTPGRSAVRAWRGLPVRSRVSLAAAVLVLGECWQLSRFGLL